MLAAKKSAFDDLVKQPAARAAAGEKRLDAESD